MQRPGWQDTVDAQPHHGSGHMTHKATAFHQDTLQTGNNWITFSAIPEKKLQWSLFLKSGNKAANALAGSTWSAVQQRFDAARKLMKKHPTERNHLRAIFTGHWVSQARFYHTQGGAVPTACAVLKFAIELMSGVALRYDTQPLQCLMMDFSKQ